MTPRIHLILGPTASGKSAQAIKAAQEEDGVIINADATQLYADLSILSARPDDAELAQAPHQLYGILPGDNASSVADWMALCVGEVEAAWQAGKLPIICGGTGLYIKALREGLSPIPDIAESTRLQCRQLLTDIGNDALHAKLAAVDPLAAAKIPAGNSQRLIRAYEVWQATGTPISAWQDTKQSPFPSDVTWTETRMELPREELYARCDQRFDRMLERGAIAEVEALLTKNYAPELPVMKAVGVPEIAVYLRGECSLEDAAETARRNTRRYAKRQLTWLRNQ